MKYDVLFNSVLKGKGAVHLNDIGILCEGTVLQGNLSVGFFAGDPIMGIRTTRTIPYSTIRTYKKPGLTSYTHQIQYELPSGAKQKILFTLLKANKEKNTAFAEHLEQLRNSTRILTGA